MTFKLPEEVARLLREKRYYVFFADGSWRTCTEAGDEWKKEQLWKLHPTATGWEGGEFLIRVVEAAYDRYMTNENKSV